MNDMQLRVHVVKQSEFFHVLKEAGSQDSKASDVLGPQALEFRLRLTTPGAEPIVNFITEAKRRFENVMGVTSVVSGLYDDHFYYLSPEDAVDSLVRPGDICYLVVREVKKIPGSSSRGIHGNVVTKNAESSRNSPAATEAEPAAPMPKRQKVSAQGKPKAIKTESVPGDKNEAQEETDGVVVQETVNNTKKTEDKKSPSKSKRQAPGAARSAKSQSKSNTAGHDAETPSQNSGDAAAAAASTENGSIGSKGELFGQSRAQQISPSEAPSQPASSQVESPGGQGTQSSEFNLLNVNTGKGSKPASAATNSNAVPSPVRPLKQVVQEETSGTGGDGDNNDDHDDDDDDLGDDDDDDDDDDDEVEEESRRAQRLRRAQVVSASRTASGSSLAPSSPSPQPPAKSRDPRQTNVKAEDSTVNKPKAPEPSKPSKGAPEVKKPSVEAELKKKDSEQRTKPDRVPGLGGFEALSKVRPAVHDNTNTRPKRYEVLENTQSSDEELESEDSSEDDSESDDSSEEEASRPNTKSDTKRARGGALRALRK